MTECLWTSRLSFKQQFDYGAFMDALMEDLQKFHTPPSPSISSSYCFHKIVFILLTYKTPTIWSFMHNLLLV